jgi:hypothetical protein
MRAAYKALRDNAKRRGKEFTLTFDQFKEFCYQTDYIAGRGRTKESYSIDRIDNQLGYTADNIRVMTVADNARKGARVLNYDWITKTATVTVRDNSVSDGPF